MTESGEPVDEKSEEFKTWIDETAKITIGDILLESFPALFTHELDEDTYETKVQKSNQRMEVLLHGVELDPNTNAYWLQLNMAYLDGFVYLSFHFKQ